MPRHIRSAWLKTLATLALLLLAAGVLGLLTGHVWMCIALASIGALAWHYWRLRRVLRRLTARQRWDMGGGNGVWNELDRLLYRNQLEMRTRKRRLLDMLRSYRAAAAALPDAVVVVDRNSQRVQWFNEAATSLLGLHHPGDLARPWSSACNQCRWPTGWPADAMPNRSWTCLPRSIRRSGSTCA